MPIWFDIRQVHDKVDRSKLSSRKSLLVIDELGNALGGFHNLCPERRVHVERAAEMIALVEINRARIGAQTESADVRAFTRLKQRTSEVVRKVELPREIETHWLSEVNG